jgi:hypothetical protein
MAGSVVRPERLARLRAAGKLASGSIEKLCGGHRHRHVELFIDDAA